MFGKLNSEDIESLVHAQLVGRIGCSNKDKSYVVPISYAYDGQYIYAHTFEGMKIDMMRKNSNVCFQVDDTKDLSNWQSVILWGEFEELSKNPERTEALKILMDRRIPFISSETMQLTSQWPFQDDDDVSKISGIVFRIRITEKTGRFEKKTEAGFYAS